VQKKIQKKILELFLYSERIENNESGLTAKFPRIIELWNQFSMKKTHGIGLQLVDRAHGALVYDIVDHYRPSVLIWMAWI
jgi:hypothetical protein